MTSPLNQQPNDVGVVFVPPAARTDPRVPTAEELSLNTRILQNVAARANRTRGWLRFPVLSFSAARQLNILNGQALMARYPGTLQINNAVATLPALPDTINTYLRTDWLYCWTFIAEVGEAQEPLLGQYSFDYTDIETEELATITKENTRRMRAFWAIVWSTTPLTVSALRDALPVAGQNRILEISDTSAQGFGLGNLRVYARDPAIAQATYTVFPESFDLLEITQVRRAQRHNNRGYIHGPADGGETSLTSQYNLISTAPVLHEEGLESRHRQRLRQIFSGIPGRSHNLDFAVQNLIASPNGGNAAFPGESAAAPNGSTCLANGQRVSFTNQAIIEKRTAIRVDSVTNNGFDRALITISLNSPIDGSFFSGNRLDHRIYSEDGIEQSERGTFRQLGSSSSLVWEGNANSTILPGQRAYCSPGIFYPAGSGFSVPFQQVTGWWLNNTQLVGANLRDAATSDLAQYADPASGGTYIGVFGSERAALHYILRRVSVQSDQNGILRIPDSARGNFAFIRNVPGRIDRPVVTGVAPNTSFDTLVYEAPAPQDVWQFLMQYPPYQGTRELNFLNGAVVVSRALFFAHTQGGGCSVFQGDADTRLSPIAMHLPAVTGGIPAYRLNAPIHLAGEPYPGPITLRELPLFSGSGLALPTPGQTLSVQAAQTQQGRSLSCRLLADNRIAGFRAPVLQGRAEYQAVVSFVARQQDEHRLIVLTHNTAGGESCAADSDAGTAIDTFRL